MYFNKKQRKIEMDNLPISIETKRMVLPSTSVTLRNYFLQRLKSFDPRLELDYHKAIYLLSLLF